jgi:hypothetical protein
MSTQTVDSNADIKQQLAVGLLSATRSLEGIFLRMGDSFPRLLDALDSSISQSMETIGRIKEGDARGNGGGLPHLVKRARKSVSNIRTRLVGMTAADRQLIEALLSGLDAIARIDDDISHINEDSLEMELISLNAMTVAIKTGQEGRGFSFITDELQKLSGRILISAERVNDEGKAIRELFSAFRDRVGQLIEREDRLAARYKEEIDAGLDLFVHGIDSLIDEIIEVGRGAREISRPIRDIMVELQHQDIIRQSVDSVVKVIDSLNNFRFSGRPDDAGQISDRAMDELAFLNIIPDLAYAMMEDIREKLYSVSEAVSAHLDDLDTRMSNLANELDAFVRAGIGSGPDSINARFAAAMSTIRDLVRASSRLMNDKQGEVSRAVELMHRVQGLERQFKAFAGLASRFHNIDVASRIEVRKTDVLQQMAGTIESMTGLTARIGGHIEDSHRATTDFLSRTEEAVLGFREQYESEAGEFRRFGIRMERLLQSIAEGKNGLIDLLTDFAFFNDHFHRLLDGTRSDLASVQSTIESLSAVQDAVRSLGEASSAHYAAALERRGIGSWSIKDGRLQHLADQFTIFTQKKTAGILGGSEVEEGVESGEVTFF